MKYEIKVADEHGNKIYFSAAIALMDDEIREEVHADMSPCTEQDFFTEYCKRHFAKYGEIFTV